MNGKRAVPVGEQGEHVRLHSVCPMKVDPIRVESLRVLS